MILLCLELLSGAEGDTLMKSIPVKIKADIVKKIDQKIEADFRKNGVKENRCTLISKLLYKILIDEPHNFDRPAASVTIGNQNLPAATKVDSKIVTKSNQRSLKKTRSDSAQVTQSNQELPKVTKMQKIYEMSLSGMTDEDISKTMGIGQSSVRSAKARYKQSIKKDLA